ncbi:hypothetical protein H9P43_008496 [Blastocladiella emersonii ATCC 22665]|nr:hypothetical protein H9P43_008496 [Blastocladiella emersonii ATCC 22665]
MSATAPPPPSDGPMQLHVRMPDGRRIPMLVDAASSVADLRVLVSAATGVAENRQKLVYAGQVVQGLVDDPDEENTPVTRFGLRNDGTLYLVIAQPKAQVSAAATLPPQLAGRPASPTRGGSGAPGTSAPGRGGGNTLEDRIASTLNHPMVEAMMGNPDLMHTMMMMDPRLRQMAESNPDVARMLRDPAFLRQMLTTSRNPAAMREMWKTQDRALANLEMLPGGFNALQRMYKSTAGALPGAAAPVANPAEDARRNRAVAARLGATPVEQGTLNTTALPNPWAARPPPAAARTSVRATPFAVPGAGARMSTAALNAETERLMAQANTARALPLSALSGPGANGTVNDLVALTEALRGHANRQREHIDMLRQRNNAATGAAAMAAAGTGAARPARPASAGRDRDSPAFSSAQQSGNLSPRSVLRRAGITVVTTRSPPRGTDAAAADPTRSPTASSPSDGPLADPATPPRTAGAPSAADGALGRRRSSFPSRRLAHPSSWPAAELLAAMAAAGGGTVTVRTTTSPPAPNGIVTTTSVSPGAVPGTRRTVITFSRPRSPSPSPAQAAAAPVPAAAVRPPALSFASGPADIPAFSLRPSPSPTSASAGSSVPATPSVTTSPATSTQALHSAGARAAWPAQLQHMLDMGFDRGASVHALAMADGDLDRAVELLVLGGGGDGGDEVAAAASVAATATATASGGDGEPMDTTP